MNSDSDGEHTQQNEEVQSQGHVQYADEKQSSSEEHSQSDPMLRSLQQLLYLQAQTPYHVIANEIHYRPKEAFIPEAFSVDEKDPHKYQTKVYYLKDEAARAEEEGEGEEQKE